MPSYDVPSLSSAARPTPGEVTNPDSNTCIYRALKTHYTGPECNGGLEQRDTPAKEHNTMERSDMERYYINITVGDAPMRVCYDRDNERLILVSVTDVQPHESVELLEGSAHDWMAKTNWATLPYTLEPVHYTHDEF